MALITVACSASREPEPEFPADVAPIIERVQSHYEQAESWCFLVEHHNTRQGMATDERTFALIRYDAPDRQIWRGWCEGCDRVSEPTFKSTRVGDPNSDRLVDYSLRFLDARLLASDNLHEAEVLQPKVWPSTIALRGTVPSGREVFYFVDRESARMRGIFGGLWVITYLQEKPLDRAEPCGFDEYPSVVIAPDGG